MPATILKGRGLTMEAIEKKLREGENKGRYVMLYYRNKKGGTGAYLEKINGEVISREENKSLSKFLEELRSIQFLS